MAFVVLVLERFWEKEKSGATSCDENTPYPYMRPSVDKDPRPDARGKQRFKNNKGPLSLSTARIFFASCVGYKDEPPYDFHYAGV